MKRKNNLKTKKADRSSYPKKLSLIKKKRRKKIDFSNFNNIDSYDKYKEFSKIQYRELSRRKYNKSLLLKFNAIDDKIPMVIKMDGIACDSDEPPSTYEKSTWLVVSGKGRIAPKEITKEVRINESGKWLIFSHSDNIDSIWKKIKELYKAGDLLIGAKCSTKKSKSLNPKGNHVIVIYCLCDEDRIHNRKVLREKAGITWEIFFKAEVDTGNKYSWNGDLNISKYYE